MFVFDVEGTLVDAALPTLECWRVTLEQFGHAVSRAELHEFSGMDGSDMLDKLLPDIPAKAKKAILAAHGERYRSDYLPSVRPLPDARALLKTLKALERKVALATDCAKDELRHYLALADVGDLIDAAACGDDVSQGKPHPDLVTLAMKQVGAGLDSAVMIGDTPYDAEAAHNAGIPAIGLLSGIFSADELRAAGCVAVFRDPSAFRRELAQEAAAGRILGQPS